MVAIVCIGQFCVKIRFLLVVFDFYEGYISLRDCFYALGE